MFRAREAETGRIVALKKVRFDNFEPESVRFMAREILILRRLDHPNIMKLDGLITSRLSCSIYLVFEYMEHDITGLLSCPDVRFSEAQVLTLPLSMLLSKICFLGVSRHHGNKKFLLICSIELKFTVQNKVQSFLNTRKCKRFVHIRSMFRCHLVS